MSNKCTVYKFYFRDTGYWNTMCMAAVNNLHSHFIRCLMTVFYESWHTHHHCYLLPFVSMSVVDAYNVPQGMICNSI